LSFTTTVTFVRSTSAESEWKSLDERSSWWRTPSTVVGPWPCAAGVPRTIQAQRNAQKI